MMQLQPVDIADAFTLTQIEAKITAITEAIAAAEGAISDRFDDTQAQIAVKRQKLEDLYNSLAVWVKAKNIISGLDSSTADLIAGNYNPGLPRI